MPGVSLVATKHAKASLQAPFTWKLRNLWWLDVNRVEGVASAASFKIVQWQFAFLGGGIEMKRNDMITYDICFLKFFMNLFDIV